MFGETYKYRLADVATISQNGIICQQHKYVFRCRFKHLYIVNLEKYEHQFYVIKFYLKQHRLSKNKYNLLSGLHDMPRIMATCLQIMLETYKENPYASFGFMGANSIGEPESNTKRFKIYKRIMESFFSPIDFSHYTYTEKSAYLMLNKANLNNDLMPNIEKMFDTYFD